MPRHNSKITKAESKAALKAQAPFNASELFKRKYDDGGATVWGQAAEFLGAVFTLTDIFDYDNAEGSHRVAFKVKLDGADTINAFSLPANDDRLDTMRAFRDFRKDNPGAVFEGMTLEGRDTPNEGTYYALISAEQAQTPVKKTRKARTSKPPADAPKPAAKKRGRKPRKDDTPF